MTQYESSSMTLLLLVVGLSLSSVVMPVSNPFILDRGRLGY